MKGSHNFCQETAFECTERERIIKADEFAQSSSDDTCEGSKSLNPPGLLTYREMRGIGRSNMS